MENGSGRLMWQEAPLFTSTAKKTGRVAVLEPERVALGRIRFDQKGITVKDLRKVLSKSTEEIDPMEPEALIDRFALALRTQKLSKRGWILALPSALFSLDIVTLPAVGKKNLESLIHRKVAASSLSGNEDQAWCYELLEEKKTEEEHFLRVLIVRTSTSLIERVHQALKKNGIRPEMITIPLSGVIPLMAQSKADSGRGPLLALENTAGSVMLSIFKEGVLNQTRFLKAKSSFDEEKFQQFLQVELRRTLSFHKERFKGEAIRNAVIFGALPDFLDDEEDSGLSLQFELPTYSRSHAKAESQEEPLKKDGFPAMMAGLLLAAKTRSRGGGIDFSLPRRRLGLKAAAALLLLAGGALGAIELSDRIENKNLNRAKYLGRLKNEVRPYQRLMQEKQFLNEMSENSRKAKAFLQEMRSKKISVAESLITAIDLLPGEIQLSAVDYKEKDKSENGKPQGHRIQMRLEGDFTGAGANGLLALMEALDHTGLFKEVTYQSHGVKRTSHDTMQMREVVDLELSLP
ncbi:MAG: hypothetical protein KJ645_06005 [Planctomycetes bacterium]|nr:hypothetical protein [Planctomycetota bacterium]